MRLYIKNNTKTIFQIPSAYDSNSESIIQISDNNNPGNTLNVTIPRGNKITSYFVVEDGTQEPHEVIQEPASICCWCNPHDPKAASTLITKNRILSDAFDCIRGMCFCFFVVNTYPPIV